MDRKPLSNPPILRATIEASFEPRKEVTLARLELFSQKLKGDFPVEGQVANQHIEFGMDGEEGSFHRFAMEQRGFAVSNKAGTKSVSIELDKYFVSFYNRYYPPWPGLKDFFFDNLEGYLAASTQEKIFELSTRIINRLFLPLQEGASFTDYITTPIAVPTTDEIPDAIAGFQTSVLIPLSPNIMARVIQQTEEATINENTGERGLFFVLDTTVTCNIEHDASDTDQISSTLDMLRKKRNSIFFATFTEKALENYA